MRIQQFLKLENIKAMKIQYYINDKGKKIPIGDLNNMSNEDFDNIDEVKRQDEIKKQLFYLSSEKKATLKECYSIFLKHTKNVYVIDVDDDKINSLDDFVNQIKIKNNKFVEYIKKCPWTKGNIKGIHIYTKIDNIPFYTSETEVYNDFKGDLIGRKNEENKGNNIWETFDKIVYNYDDSIPEIEYKEIKTIFNKSINNDKVDIEFSDDEEEEKPKDKKEKKEKKDKVGFQPITSNDNETIDYIKVCLKYKVFELFTEKCYERWRNLGFLIKNILGDDGSDLFNEISKQMPKYEGEKKCNSFYDSLITHIKPDKQMITLGSLKKWIKDIDNDLYNKINKETKTTYKFEIDEMYIDNFDTTYFNTLKTYQNKKTYFELFICKVLQPQAVFIWSENNKDKDFNTILYSKDNLTTAFEHLKSGIFKKEKETKFIDEWFNDDEMKNYKCMDFLPFNGIRNINKKNNTDTYNLFNGYNKNIESEYKKENKEQLLKPFKDLLYELVGADKECFDYFYNFLGHLIQKPNERIPIAFIFKSKQGVGKNVMLEAIGNIIGQAHYISSSNAKDFFGDYAEGLYRKLLVNINECEGKDTFDYEGRLKSIITEDKMTLNPKFIRQYTINNYARLIIFTNKPNPIPIDVRSKDRRYVVYQSTEKYLDKKYGTTFWNKLVAHLKKPEFIACLYEDLNSIDLNKIKWKESRPITKAYLEMCKLYVPVEAMFLESWIEEDKDNNLNSELSDEEYISNKIDIPTVDFYERYKDYCRKFGYITDKSYQQTLVKFTSRLSELDLEIHKQKTEKTTVFRFTPKYVLKTMEERNWIIKKELEIDVEELKNIGGDDFDDYFA
jgi:hypothetical protein